jgi:hypothetical protein
VNDQAIWLVAGGPMQVPVARQIRERGFRLVISDGNADCACASMADDLVVCDTFDAPAHLRAAEGLRMQWDIRAVMTAAADCHGTVAEVARALKLHGIDPAISRACRLKHLTRQALSDAGVPQPSFKAVKTFDETAEFLRGLDWKGVVKATDNSGSRGFSLIRKESDLSPEVVEHARASGTTGLVLVEALLEPVENEIAEQSVETVWVDGRMRWLNWVDRLFRKDFLRFDAIKDNPLYADVGWGVEIGHINPAVHDVRTTQAVRELMEHAGRAIGMDTQRGGHILKGDIMLTKEGPRLLELTPRLSGGWDSSCTTPARGANFIGGVISMALDEPITADLWDRCFEYHDATVYASILTHILSGARDCIGRMFALGTAPSREGSLQEALKNLKEKRYVIPMEQ